MTDIRIKISREEAEGILGKLPMGRDFWLDLAEQVLNAYDKLEGRE